MITVERREQIRRAYYIEKKSIRQIARELHVSRKTVDKAIASAEPVPYTLTQPRPAPVSGDFLDRIAELLAENEHLPRKQRNTSHKIYDRLFKDHGYRGSESRIRTLVAQLRRAQQPPRLFLPLAFDPGQDAQVDWGEADVIFQGTQQTVQVFVMRLCYSRRLFVRAYPSQKQESFFDAHIHAFHHFQGVPHRLSYDNLTTAVKKILTGHARDEQAAFVIFRSHYLFESFFCNPAAGHEKGGVEHGVGFSRRNFMVPLLVADSFDDLNAQLLQRCLEDDQRRVDRQPTTIAEAWQHEQPLLRPLPPRDLPCYVQRSATLTPYSQVVFETNRYSVPVDRAVRQLTLKAYPFVLEILHQDQVLARHPRCYGRDQDLFDPLHYLPLLEQRPAAFEHAVPMRRWREGWPLVYKRLLFRLRERWPDGRGIREFVRVLQLLRAYPADLVNRAIGQALEYGCLEVDGVRLCLHHLQHPDQPATILDLSQYPQLAEVGGQPIDLSVYDHLLSGGI